MHVGDVNKLLNIAIILKTYYCISVLLLVLCSVCLQIIAHNQHNGLFRKLSILFYLLKRKPRRLTLLIHLLIQLTYSVTHSLMRRIIESCNHRMIELERS